MLLNVLIKAAQRPVVHVDSAQFADGAQPTSLAGLQQWNRSFLPGDLVVWSVATKNSTISTTADVSKATNGTLTTYDEMETTTTTVKRRLRFFSFVFNSSAAFMNLGTNFSTASGEYEVVTASLFRGANTTAYDQLRTTSSGDIDLKQGGVLVAHGLGFDDTSNDGIIINNDLGTQIVAPLSVTNFTDVSARKIVGTSTETLTLSNTDSTPTNHFIYALSFRT